MLDIKYIISNTEKVIKALENRNSKIDINVLLELDKSRKELLQQSESLKAEKNKASALVPKLIKEGQDVSQIKEDMKKVSCEIKEIDEKLVEVENDLNDFILNLPNLPEDDVPIGKDENDNVEIRKHLKPTEFSFTPKPHWELGEELELFDPTSAGKVSGARFVFYKGLGARLERAIMNFMMDTHSESGYTEILPPYIVNRKSMTGTGQLPKFEDDAFKIDDSEYFLIPTAEVPVTNLMSGETMMEKDLPKKFCAYSACFRREAGSAGRDTRGLIRQHQFNKVELVNYSLPGKSSEALEEMTSQAESILKALKLPYRVILLCTGDMGFSSKKTYDIEVFMPSYNRYVEISSCSNCGDFQARRMNIKYKENINDKPKLIHTLNGSALAVGRTFAAIIENYQNEDGSITIPDVLVPYMRMDKIEKK